LGCPFLGEPPSGEGVVFTVDLDAQPIAAKDLGGQ
jgi:hypothetical protein